MSYWRSLCTTQMTYYCDTPLQDVLLEKLVHNTDDIYCDTPLWDVLLEKLVHNTDDILL